MDTSSPGYYSHLFSGTQAGRHLQMHHRFKEVKSLPGRSFIQDGNAVLHHSTSSTTGMDCQDRPQRWLSPYTSSYEHQQVLSLCYSWKDLPVPCSPVWTLNCPPRVHQNFGTSGSAAQYSGHMGSCLSGRMDYPSRFPGTESFSYSWDHPPVTISRLNYKLQEVYASSLTQSGLLGPPFQSRKSHHISSKLILRFSHQCPIPSIDVNSHACTQDFIHHQSNLAFRSLYPSWTPAAQVPSVLDKETLGSAQVILGHSSTTNFSLTCVASTDRMFYREFLCIFWNPACSSSRMHP